MTTTNDESKDIDMKQHPMTTDGEIDYLEWCRKHPSKVYSAHPDSPQEGFEYFFMSRPDIREKHNPFKDRGIPMRAMPSFIWIFRGLRKGMKDSWKAIMPYLEDMKKTQFELRPGLWDELHSFVRKEWDDVIIGFTELPSQMIFRGKSTLFKYALVVGQEMDKEEIDKAPSFEAGKETMSVYNSLGHVVNDIAEWLRERGIRCQSNHPLGGLTNTPSLAGKAGMGWQGRHGLLITPEYGPRLRLAPVFLEHKYFEFTDNKDHVWIEDYCESCGRCQRECPMEAIYTEKQVNIDGVPGIGELRTCIDRDKCFEYFFKTMGCSICIKVCPFSRAGGTYERLKSKVCIE